jgi:hypothetical protein
MCGICGIVTGTISNTEAEIFKKLLVMSAFRGKDSTGVFAVQGDNKELRSAYIKQATNPMNFLDATAESFDKELNTSDAKALIGHTRYATKGDVTKKNAHPFDFPNVIGVHNGTLLVNPKTKKTYETDSESLYAFMNEHGLDETLTEISQAGDAYVLIWFDKKAGTLNAIRNDKRPLAFAPVSNGNTVYWASEDSTLRYILHRENIHFKEIYTIHPGHLLTFNMLEHNPATAYEVTKVKIKPKVYASTYGTWSKPDDRGVQRFNRGVRTGPWEGAGNGVPGFLQRGADLRSGVSSPQSETTSTSTPTTTPGTQTEGMDIKGWEQALADYDAEEQQEYVYDKVENKFVPKTKEGAQETKSVRDSIGPSENNVVPISRTRGDVAHEQGGFYWIGTRAFTAQEFERKLSQGCAWCTTHCDADDKDIEWMNIENYLCGDCKERPEVQEYKPFYGQVSKR